MYRFDYIHQIKMNTIFIFTPDQLVSKCMHLGLYFDHNMPLIFFLSYKIHQLTGHSLLSV